MKMKKRVVLFIVIFVIATLLPTFSKASCNTVKESIFLAEETNDADEKVKHYTLALKDCPDNLELLTLLIDLYLKNENFDAAYSIAYKIISANRYAADGYHKLALIHTAWEEYDKAEEAVENALMINSYSINSYVLLGDIKYYTRNYKDAMKNYRKAIELDSYNKEANKKIANLFFLFDKNDKVLLYLNRALKISRDDETLMVKELIEKRVNNDYEGIKIKAQAILKSYPKNLIALETLSMAMLENENEKSECLELLTKAYRLERQPFMKSKIEKEIEKIVTPVASSK